MKKIIKPAEKEESVYYSDFKGVQFDVCGPNVEVNISFNYGSQYDGSELKLHLTDEEFEGLFNHIKQSVSEEYKQALKRKLSETEKHFNDSIQFREWDSCDMHCNSISLYKKMLNIRD